MDDDQVNGYALIGLIRDRYDEHSECPADGCGKEIAGFDATLSDDAVFIHEESDEMVTDSCTVDPGDLDIDL